MYKTDDVNSGTECSNVIEHSDYIEDTNLLQNLSTLDLNKLYEELQRTHANLSKNEYIDFKVIRNRCLDNNPNKSIFSLNEIITKNNVANDINNFIANRHVTFGNVEVCDNPNELMKSSTTMGQYNNQYEENVNENQNLKRDIIQNFITSIELQKTFDNSLNSVKKDSCKNETDSIDKSFKLNNKDLTTIANKHATQINLDFNKISQDQTNSNLESVLSAFNNHDEFSYNIKLKPFNNYDAMKTKDLNSETHNSINTKKSASAFNENENRQCKGSCFFANKDCSNNKRCKEVLKENMDLESNRSSKLNPYNNMSDNKNKEFHQNSIISITPKMDFDLNAIKFHADKKNSNTVTITGLGFQPEITITPVPLSMNQIKPPIEYRKESNTLKRKFNLNVAVQTDQPENVVRNSYNYRDSSSCRCCQSKTAHEQNVTNINLSKNEMLINKSDNLLSKSAKISTKSQKINLKSNKPKFCACFTKPEASSDQDLESLNSLSDNYLKSSSESTRKESEIKHNSVKLQTPVVYPKKKKTSINDVYYNNLDSDNVYNHKQKENPVFLPNNGNRDKSQKQRLDSVENDEFLLQKSKPFDTPKDVHEMILHQFYDGDSFSSSLKSQSERLNTKILKQNNVPDSCFGVRNKEEKKSRRSTIPDFNEQIVNKPNSYSKRDYYSIQNLPHDSQLINSPNYKSNRKSCNGQTLSPTQNQDCPCIYYLPIVMNHSMCKHPSMNNKQ